MDPWATYQSRIGAKGSSKRESILQRERRTLESKLRNDLSYHHVTVNGIDTEVSIINSDNLNIKTIISMPGEDIRHGSTVDWMGNHWLVTKKDYNNEIYTKATMQQCNYLLKWITDDGNIVQRWCIIEDGTKYLTGEYGDNNYVVDKGDSRITMTLPRDAETVKLNRNNRFLIDDYSSPNVLAYRLTKPFKLGGSFNETGVLSFVLAEVNTEDADNLELHIANYYKFFPKDDEHVDIPEPPTFGAVSTETKIEDKPGDEQAKEVWL